MTPFTFIRNWSQHIIVCGNCGWGSHHLGKMMLPAWRHEEQEISFFRSTYCGSQMAACMTSNKLGHWYAGRHFSQGTILVPINVEFPWLVQLPGVVAFCHLNVSLRPWFQCDSLGFDVDTIRQYCAFTIEIGRTPFCLFVGVNGTTSGSKSLIGRRFSLTGVKHMQVGRKGFLQDGFVQTFWAEFHFQYASLECRFSNMRSQHSLKLPL